MEGIGGKTLSGQTFVYAGWTKVPAQTQRSPHSFQNWVLPLNFGKAPAQGGEQGHLPMPRYLNGRNSARNN
jgi:hypothetical protein